MQQGQGLQSEMSQDASERPHQQQMAVADQTVADQTGTAGTEPTAALKSAAERFAMERITVETRLIELGSALAVAQQLFKALERDFYLTAFGRYEE